MKLQEMAFYEIDGKVYQASKIADFDTSKHVCINDSANLDKTTANLIVASPIMYNSICQAIDVLQVMGNKMLADKSSDEMCDMVMAMLEGLAVSMLVAEHGVGAAFEQFKAEANKAKGTVQ